MTSLILPSGTNLLTLWQPPYTLNLEHPVGDHGQDIQPANA
jgi:hypothetical protein